MQDATPNARPPTLALIVTWLIVGLPLAWGVYQTFVKALALFQ